MVKIILRKMNKLGDTKLPDFKIYYKVIEEKQYGTGITADT